ncbi:MAG: P1 family peptidase [Bdellovibrionales bacterium]|nr:P1 family peptidase [Bdellovibrionales bacterium]
MNRGRVREFGLCIGRLAPGPLNAITDVPGVLVGQTTLIRDRPEVVRTGCTVIAPCEGRMWDRNLFAGFFAFNGFGEVTGAQWIEEAGVLSSPIALVGTTAVGTAHRALQQLALDSGLSLASCFPVILETADTWLNPLAVSALSSLDVYQALSSAASGPVAEGNVGGGTGMMCYEFKGGIGTSSRIVAYGEANYTVGALVQSNHGKRHQLRISGLPVKEVQGVPLPWEEQVQQGSIVVIIATDAPLLPVQLKRLAKRATVGLARTGGIGENGSGDFFLAFSTANEIPLGTTETQSVRMLPHDGLNALFEGVADAVEEAILNSLTQAETMTGVEGRTVYALPTAALQATLR